MNDSIEMVRRCYGYGRWDAPYWFIGPEQGKGRDEPADNTRRVEAWVELGRPEVCDCAAFHRLIAEERWHGQGARLQPTWRRLILLLLTFLGAPAEKEDLRAFQGNQWGANPAGTTCVVELSGLAVKSSSVAVDRNQFRTERIEAIRQAIQLHQPKIVVMYGAGEKESWRRIAGQAISPNQIVRSGSTLFTLARHPTAHGSSDARWIELGQQLRAETARRA